MSTDTESEVDEIIAERLQLDRDEFDDDTRFEEDLDAESLDLVEIAEVIDQELGVYIPDEDLGTLHTVGDVKTYVHEHAE